MSFSIRIVIYTLLFSLAACGGEPDSAGTPASKAPTYLLTADHADAVGVTAARELKPGTEVAVFGRVQELSPGGLAIFNLVDDSIAYCGRGQESCGCMTPWDYCCEEPAMQAARMAVELRDKSGKPVKADDLGLRLLDLVAVRGTLHETEEGGLFLVADDGWYRRERPDLPDGLSWPE